MRKLEPTRAGISWEARRNCRPNSEGRCWPPVGLTISVGTFSSLDETREPSLARLLLVAAFAPAHLLPILFS